MPEEKDVPSNELLRQLEIANSKLEIIDQLDYIRDTSREPSAMFSSIVHFIADYFSADMTMMALIDKDTGELELKAIDDRDQVFADVGTRNLQELSRKAITEDKVVIWDDREELIEAGIPDPPEGFEVAAVPIIMGKNIRLGAILVARSDKSFTRRDEELLQTAEDHIDSAIVQSYDQFELQIRNKELHVIYHVDRIRDQQLPFDEMLTAVLEEIRRVIPAEMGFIMLYNHKTDKLEMRAVSHDDLFQIAPQHEAIQQVARESLQSSRLTWHNELGAQMRSIMCIPLILRTEIIGVFGLVNRYRPGGFDEEDRRLLIAIASQMDTAIFESLEQRKLKQVLGRSVDPRVMQQLLENPDVNFLRGERSMVTVLYADIRGSTSLAERTEPEELVGFINDYLGKMSDVIFKHEGTLDKFVGDEVMALFGAPFPQEDQAIRAVRAGLEMQVAHQSVMKKWKEKGLDDAPIGIGIATGELIVGEMGSDMRTDYTVIGPAANLGARICSVAPASQVLISQATYEMVKDEIEAKPITGVNLKGIGKDVTIYNVVKLKE